MMKTKDLVALPFRLMRDGGMFLLKGRTLRTKTGAALATRAEYGRWLNRSGKGLLLDGRDLRMSEQESFQNTCVIARVGAGKTTNYIVPNVLERASRRCSIVVNDPKGEVFELTSKHMESRGFKVIVIDPENLARSSRFNPLLEIGDDIELEQMAEIIVRTANPNERDPYWNNGAIRFVSLFLKCLKNMGKQRGNDKLLTMSNLHYLFQKFGKDGRALDEWMLEATIDPDNPSDQRLLTEWHGLLTGNEKTIQSFVTSGLMALRGLSNDNIAKLTGRSTFSLGEMRQCKTIIYFITPPQHAEYYGFFTSLFFRSVFNMAMRQMPEHRDLPLYVMYDEFGHSTLPNFGSTANTIRGFRVSLSIVLQSIAQLEARYGKADAQAILGGFNSYVTYSGSDPETASFFERIIGKVRDRQSREFLDHIDEYRDYYLMHANEIRTMEKDQVLIVSANKKPVLLNVTPWYKSRRFTKMTKRGSVVPPAMQGDDTLEFIRL